VTRARSILLVAHVTPPVTMSAARRAAGLTKHLARLGHRITVLTSVMSGSGAVPGAACTVRARDLLVSPLNWRRASFAALKGEADGAYSGSPSALAAWVIPDLEVVGWVPFALPRALALAQRERFDCVITSSPPQSGHLIGLALQKRGVPWVADFRDGWTFERQDRELGLFEGLDRRLERLVATRADAVSAVTEPIADDLRKRFDRTVATITNGFDPELVGAVSGSADGLLSAVRRSIVHTGNLAFGGRSPESLLTAFRALRATAPEIAERLEIVFVGPMTKQERSILEAADLGDAVRLTGPVAHETALAIQRAADGLLVITGPEQSGVATGKLYEYLVAKRPILVIGNDTAAARIVDRVGAGISVARDDQSALIAALRAFAEHPDQLPRARPESLSRFSYQSVAENMAAQVERAIAGRADATGSRHTGTGSHLARRSG
jgi:glycosyltransferase involved in cell wall biosynthesis